jgi:hypothetical protein
MYHESQKCTQVIKFQVLNCANPDAFTTHATMGLRGVIVCLLTNHIAAAVCPLAPILEPKERDEIYFAFGFIAEILSDPPNAQQYVKSSSGFIAAGLASLPEAAYFVNRTVEELRIKSGVEIKPEVLEEGVCPRDEEGQCTGQCRYRHSSRAESLFSRYWQAARESNSAWNNCECGCNDESDGW